MSIIRTAKRENPFVQLDKFFLSDDQLTFEAKGILAYVLSKPDTWTIRKEDMIKRSKSGKTRIESAMLELMANGYLNWYRLREEDGTFGEWVYDVYERPEFNPEAKKFIEEGKIRIEARKSRTKSRNNKNKSVIQAEDSPKVDNQLLDSPKVDYPPLDNPPLDNQPYSNNEFSDIEFSNNELKEEEEEGTVKGVITFFENSITTTNPTIKEALNDWVNLLPIEIIKNEITFAAKHNAKSYAYLEKLLKQDLKLEIDTIEKLEQKRNEHAKSKSPVRNTRTSRNEKVPEWFKQQQEERKEKKDSPITIDVDKAREELQRELGAI